MGAPLVVGAAAFVTSQQLAEYVAYFHPRFLGVTGPEEELTRLTRDLGIFVSRGSPDAHENYLVGHGSAVLLIDPAGRFIGVYQPPHDPAKNRRELPAGPPIPGAQA